MTSAVEPQCVWPLGAELGEGPIWSAKEQALWFVDIKKDQIHRYDTRSGSGTSVAAPPAPGFIAPAHAGGFIVGAKSGLHSFDPVSGTFAVRHAVEPERTGNRLNDGAVDSRGRLWFGSMDDGEKAPSGRLFRLDASGPRAMDDGYVITNGPAFSPDARTLYHTDTVEGVIYAFDVSEDGALSNKRLFVRIPEGAGHPDGPTVDWEGCVWTAQFAGWSVLRYSPRGELLTTVRFPCANITKIAFGGADLRTVYATSARWLLDDDARHAQPLAGGLFRFEADVPGLPQYEVLHG